MPTAAEIITSLRIDNASLEADAGTARAIFANLRRDLERSLDVSAPIRVPAVAPSARAPSVIPSLRNVEQPAAQGSRVQDFITNTLMARQTRTENLNAEQQSALAQWFDPQGFRQAQREEEKAFAQVRAAEARETRAVIVQRSALARDLQRSSLPTAQRQAAQQPQRPPPQRPPAQRDFLAGQGTNFALTRLASTARNLFIATGAGVALAAREFAKAEEAESHFAAALAATGSEVQTNRKQFNDFANAMERITTLTNGEVKELGTLALNLGVSADKVQEVVKAGIGLGQSLFGGNFNQGVKVASLAVQGETQQLRGLIPALRGVKDEQQVLAYVNKQATIGLREARADVDTFAGSMRGLRRDTREAAAEIGQVFAPDIKNVAGHIRNVAKEIRDLNPDQQRALKNATETVGALSLFSLAGLKAAQQVKSLGILSGASFAGVASGIAAVGVALAGLGALYINARSKQDNFTDRATESWNKTTDDISRFVAFAGPKLASVFDTAGEHIDRLVFRAKYLFEELSKGNVNIDFTDADKAYDEYRRQQDEKKKQDAAHDAAQRKADTDAQKSALDQQANATDESVQKEKSSYAGLRDYYRDIQRAILNNAKRSAAAQAAATAPKVPSTQPSAVATTQPSTATKPPQPAPPVTRAAQVAPPKPTEPAAIRQQPKPPPPQRDIGAEMADRQKQIEDDVEALSDLDKLQQRTPSFRNNATTERLRQRLRARINTNRQFVTGVGDVAAGKQIEEARAARERDSREAEEATGAVQRRYDQMKAEARDSLHRVTEEAKRTGVLQRTDTEGQLHITHVTPEEAERNEAEINRRMDAEFQRRADAEKRRTLENFRRKTRERDEPAQLAGRRQMEQQTAGLDAVLAMTGPDQTEPLKRGEDAIRRSELARERMRDRQSDIIAGRLPQDEKSRYAGVNLPPLGAILQATGQASPPVQQNIGAAMLQAMTGQGGNAGQNPTVQKFDKSTDKLSKSADALDDASKTFNDAVKSAKQLVILK